MGNPADFPGRNFTFTHPTGGDLPALLTTQPGAGGTVVSCWEMTDEELAEIARTGKVWLIIWGNGVPPVWVGGITPLEYSTTGDGAAGSPPKTGEGQ